MNNFNFKKEGKSKYFLFLLFFLVVLPMVTAQTPFQQGTSLEGFEFRVGAPEFSQLFRGFDFHAHVFNASNGVPIIDGISCYFHLYNQTGNHILEMEDATASHDFDYGFQIPGQNISSAGEYSWIVQCNDSTQGGFAADSLQVSSTGFIPNIAFYIIILILSAGVIILGFAIKDAPVTILGSMGLYFVGLYILFNGITGVRDLTTTWAFGIIILMLAAYISIRSSYELITDAD